MLTTFQIKQQDGNRRKLFFSPDLPETPWLFRITESGLFLSRDIIFKQYSLTENGLVLINPIDLSDEEYLQEIPEYSILSPRLLPDIEYEKSRAYEQNLFLDRLDKYKLPKFFGLLRNPLDDTPNYLQDLINFQPSLIVVQMPPIQKLPAKSVINLLISTRDKIPKSIAVYLPGGSPIGLLNFMNFLGVDIFDTGAAFYDAYNKISYSHREYRRNKGSDIHDLIKINLTEIENEFSRLLEITDLHLQWNLITRDMHLSPMHASFVKTFLKVCGNIKGYSKFSTHRTYFIGDEDLYSPVVQNYRNHLLKVYDYPQETKLLVLLPCSAKKPYAESRSHKVFQNVIKQGTKKHVNLVEVWSLTSPLGVVPRELEEVYPAGYYDIPVSGDWSYEEIEFTSFILKSMIGKLPSDVKVIAHVSKDYLPLIESIRDKVDVISWIDDKPTSREATNKLRETLQSLAEYLAQYAPISKKSVLERKYRAITKWEFGKEFEIDFSNLQSKGFAPKPIQLKKGSIHWATYDFADGRLKLSLDAIQTSNFKTNNWVTFNGEELIGSTIFKPGIIDVGSDLSPNDEVLIFNNDKTKLLGVGRLQIPSHDIQQIKNGAIVVIRKKYKNEPFNMEGIF
jgi:archaeosine synthase alpha-subunit